MIQIRPIGIPGAVFYSPARDVAYVGFDAIVYAVVNLGNELDNMPQWLSDYLQRNNIDKEVLRESLQKFTDSIYELCHNERTMDNHSFVSVPFEIQAVIMHYVARVFVGMTVDGWKQAHEMPVESIDKDAFFRDSLKYVGQFFNYPRYAKFLLQCVHYVINLIESFRNYLSLGKLEQRERG